MLAVLECGLADLAGPETRRAVEFFRDAPAPGFWALSAELAPEFTREEARRRLARPEA